VRGVDLHEIVGEPGVTIQGEDHEEDESAGLLDPPKVEHVS
jgi:hypothetical protein